MSRNEIYYSSTELNRNVVNLINVPRDNYELQIFAFIQRVNSTTLVACAEFNFAIYVEPYIAHIHFHNSWLFEYLFDFVSLLSEEKFMFKHYLPKSLDSFGYLIPSGNVVLSNDYFMTFDGNDTTTFTVKDVSPILYCNKML